MLKIDTHEVEKRYEEFGILNLESGKVLDGTFETQQAAEFDALLYPRAVVVSHLVYETKWVLCRELPA